MNPTFTITIMAGIDGGHIVYEAVHLEECGSIEQRLVFGGDHEQCSKYIAERIGKMTGAVPPPARQIEAPAKIRVRKIKRPDVDPLDVLEALEKVA